MLLGRAHGRGGREHGRGRVGLERDLDAGRVVLLHGDGGGGRFATGRVSVDGVSARVRKDHFARCDRMAIEAHRRVGEARDEDDRDARHALRRVPDAPVDEPEDVGGPLHARLVGGGLVVIQGRDEAAKMLLAEGGMVTDP